MELEIDFGYPFYLTRIFIQSEHMIISTPMLIDSITTIKNCVLKDVNPCFNQLLKD